MMGRKVFIPNSPQRIISLVPSQTELLYDLGIADRIVGQTVFCIHPKSYFKNATKVGGTKKVRYELIKSLNPDLIICNKEENTEEIVNHLSELYPVWVSNIHTIDDACKMILAIGEIAAADQMASKMVDKIREDFKSPARLKKRSCIYLIWKNPYMAAGSVTFIQDMLTHAGFINLMPENSRYPELDISEIVQLQPEVLLLSSEPYPFAEKHIQELALQLPLTKIMLVDGEFFSWYGSHLVNSRFYFRQLQDRLNTED